MAPEFYLLVRTYLLEDGSPDPHAHVWLCKKDGPAHSQVAHGHAWRDTIEEMCKQFAAGGIKVVREDEKHEAGHYAEDEVEPAVKRGTLFGE